jgi:uncharacterized protein (TIGR03435 family)
MTRVFAYMSFAALFSGTAFAQPTATAPAFEIADVHASTRGGNPRMTGGGLRADRYQIRNASMLDLIRIAYGIDDRTMIGADDNSRIVGGPNWLDLDRFDVLAKAPPSTPRDTVKLMLRSLLTDRFKLVVHADSKPLPAFVLSMGKGKPKLKEADRSGTPGCRSQPQDPPHFAFFCRNITMEAFAQGLRGMSFAINNTAVDSTGLKGAWDFNIKWKGPPDPISVFEAIDQQLGLMLEPQKVPMPVIVVDSVNRKPTDNPPGVTTSLPPPPPAEFEVAEIRPSMPGANPRSRLQPGGRFDVQAFTLRRLINLAWNINNDGMLAGAPKFLDSTRFDVIAKASTSTNGPASAPGIDFDDARLMLRALLAERFKLATHTEDRPVTAYKLVAVKPKLQKADPANRAGCKEGPGADGKDPRVASPWLARLVSCQNLTMAQFAEQLPFWAGDYLRSPVADATGINGAFDFTLSFSPAGLLQLPGQAAQPGVASDPNGLLSLFDALNKQLGLKLETEKRPLPVLVIDHVEEKPTDN